MPEYMLKERITEEPVAGAVVTGGKAKPKMRELIVVELWTKNALGTWGPDGVIAERRTEGGKPRWTFPCAQRRHDHKFKQVRAITHRDFVKFPQYKGSTLTVHESVRPQTRKILTQALLLPREDVRHRRAVTEEGIVEEDEGASEGVGS